MNAFSRSLPSGIRASRGLISSWDCRAETTLEALAEAWIEKKRMFERQVRALDMEAVRSFGRRSAWSVAADVLGIAAQPGSPRGRGTARGVREHPSRTDVPHLARVEQGSLENGLARDESATLAGGPIHRTSPLLEIAVCAPDVPPAEQVRRIREATVFLTDGFAKINRTIALPAVGMPDRFTKSTIAAWLARRHDLSRRQAGTLIDDYLSLVESGMLLGHRVPLGRLGRLSLKKRPAGRPGSAPTRPRGHRSRCRRGPRRPCHASASAGSSRIAPGPRPSESPPRYSAMWPGQYIQRIGS